MRVPMLVLLLVPLTASCKDKDKKPEGGPTGGQGSATTPSTKTPAPANDLAMIAADSEVVLGMNWQAVQASMLWKKFALPQLEKEKDVVEIVEAIKTRCDIDVRTAPTKVVLGLKGIKEEVPDGAAIVHGLDKAKAMACPKKFEAEATKEGVVIKVEGDIITMNDADGYGMGLTFAGDRAVLLLGHQMSAARVKQALSGEGALASSKAFVDMHGKLDTTAATGWGLVRGNIVASELEDVIPAKPMAVYGTVTLTDAVSAALRMRFDSAATATDVVTKLKPQVDAVAGMVDQATIATDGADATLAVAAAGAKLQALLENLD